MDNSIASDNHSNITNLIFLIILICLAIVIIKKTNNLCKFSIFWRLMIWGWRNVDNVLKRQHRVPPAEIHRAPSEHFGFQQQAISWWNEIHNRYPQGALILVLFYHRTLWKRHSWVITVGLQHGLRYRTRNERQDGCGGLSTKSYG